MERMPMQRLLFAAAAAAAIAVAAPALAADDPGLNQVYDQVHAGHLGEAETMMAQVLRDHPNSAKAHYVDAEVLAREGRLADARAELAQAERLAPGLPFAKSESTEALRSLIAGRSADRGAALANPAVPARSGFSWGPLLLIAGAIVLLALLFRSRRAAQMPMGGVGPGFGSGPAPGYGPGPVGPYGGGAPYGGGGGIGSGIVGGLATGAAVGAGLVAGEALAHEVMGGHGHAEGAQDWTDNAAAAPLAGNDIDDRDFGVQDSGSWDDGGSSMGGGGGSDDWS
jgi:uncharacterized protein